MESKDKTLSAIMSTIVTGGTNRVTLADGKEVTIMVCNGETLPLLLDFAAKISEDLGLSLSDPEGIKEKLLEKADNVSFILKLISGYTKDVYGLVAGMCSLGNAASVAALPVDDLLKVIQGVISVNRDFFMARVLPIFRGGKL